MRDALEGVPTSVLDEAREAFRAYHEGCDVSEDWDKLSDLGKLAWVRVVFSLRGRD